MRCLQEWELISGKASNPEPMFGSFAESGLDSTHCFDRDGRLGLYGFSEVRDRPLLPTRGNADVKWETVNWGHLQAQCVEANKARFSRNHRPNLTLTYPEAEEPHTQHRTLIRVSRSSKRSLFSSWKESRDRTAVILRGWQGVEYTPELLQSIRSMISELSLHSGGEYSVYLMVEIKDRDRHILTSPGSGAYQKALDDIIPREFHNMTILFNQDLLNAWYPEIDPRGGQAVHMNQPLQLFSIMNPDFTFVWQLELDVRYTGNWFDFLENAHSWAQKQPRKLQFERAAQFYIPSYHGTYANFSDSVETANPDGGIWGPVRSDAVSKPLGPRPPKETAAEDDYAWGVGEKADVISVSPIIDLNHTDLFMNAISGFPEGQDTPRRSLMVTPVIRLSRQLLRIMHDAQRDQGLYMRSEMFAHTIALLHGFKVAHFPIPLYLDHQDEVHGPAAVDTLFNTAGPHGTFTSSAARDAVRMRARSTYWWRLEFEQYPRALYRRWYGLEGEAAAAAAPAPAAQGGHDAGGVEEKEEEETPYPYPAGPDKVGRLCLPGMLLHPVKGIKDQG